MKNFIEWRQPGKYDVDLASLESALPVELMGESMTQQHLGPDTDINVMVRRFGLTGEFPVRREVAAYGEFDEAMDFQTLLHNVKAGEEMFSRVPAEIRGKFGNDAGAFLEWIHDDANYPEAEKLGLVPVRAGPAVGPAVVPDVSGVVGAVVSPLVVEVPRV